MIPDVNGIRSLIGQPARIATNRGPRIEMRVADAQLARADLWSSNNHQPPVQAPLYFCVLVDLDRANDGIQVNTGSLGKVRPLRDKCEYSSPCKNSPAPWPFQRPLCCAYGIDLLLHG